MDAQGRRKERIQPRSRFYNLMLLEAILIQIFLIMISFVGLLYTISDRNVTLGLMLVMGSMILQFLNVAWPFSLVKYIDKLK